MDYFDKKIIYNGPDRRSKKVWDRRIPNMPIGFGVFTQFVFKSKKRFWLLLLIACIGWIGIISHITIIVYKFFNHC
jgi:hypothetical protein